MISYHMFMLFGPNKSLPGRDSPGDVPVVSLALCGGHELLHDGESSGRETCAPARGFGGREGENAPLPFFANISRRMDPEERAGDR